MISIIQIKVIPDCFLPADVTDLAKQITYSTCDSVPICAPSKSGRVPAGKDLCTYRAQQGEVCVLHLIEGWLDFPSAGPRVHTGEAAIFRLSRIAGSGLML